MEPADVEDTAFITDRGLYCYRVMPFGLKNAGATYQRLVNWMFAQLLGQSVEVYVDDMLVKSRTADQHVDRLTEVFAILRQYRMRLNPAKCVFGVESGKFLGFMVSQRGIEANPEKIRALVEMVPPANKKEVQKTLGLYLSVSECAVSSVLTREVNGSQRAVYYVSRALTGTENRYPLIEKLALALIVTARRLRPYFQAHPISVLTTQPLRQVLHRPEVSGRLIKWSVELSEFHIEYRPRTAMKGQAVADFISEFTPSILSLEPLSPTPPPPPPEEPSWLLHVDGASNRHGGGAGIVLSAPDGTAVEYALRFQFRATNNEAEYEALLAGLRLAHDLGAQGLRAHSDSLLIVNQINDTYQARGRRMTQYVKEAQRLASQFAHFAISQVPRSQNCRADALAKLASALDGGIRRSIPIEYLASPTVSGTPTEAMIVEADDTWMTPIYAYLASGTLPADSDAARRLQLQSGRYTIINAQLYKRGRPRNPPRSARGCLRRPLRIPSHGLEGP
ncbi:unnamed protein product, partial [Prunus brigantina]